MKNIFKKVLSITIGFLLIFNSITVAFADKPYTPSFVDPLAFKDVLQSTNITEYFNDASKELIKLVQTETLQYLLEEINGKVSPIITTAFWGTRNQLFSRDTFEELLQKGGFLLENQTMELEDGIEAWKEYYDMTEQQCGLLQTVYNRKITQPSKKLILSKDEITLMGTDDREGLEESKISFNEIYVDWE